MRYVDVYCALYLELERVLKGPGVDGEGCLRILGDIFGAHICRPHHLCLVQELVNFQHWSLFVWSVWMYRCQQSRSAFAL